MLYVFVLFDFCTLCVLSKTVTQEDDWEKEVEEE
jgi:hypothetical protein